MPIGLIIAILELIMKLPEIIKVIKEIIDRIHERPLHLHGPLIQQLHSLVITARHSGDDAQLKLFRASLHP